MYNQNYVTKIDKAGGLHCTICISSVFFYPRIYFITEFLKRHKHIKIEDDILFIQTFS